MGLDALVGHAAYQRIRTLLGTEPEARDVPRRREKPSPKTKGDLMVLVDTSVWIRAFANRAPYRAELDRLLRLVEVTGHELVYGEPLIHDRGGRRKVLAAYERMHQAVTIPHHDIVAFVRDRGLQGRGVCWIDVHLLASAIVGRLQSWTADPCLSAMANKFGVAYEV